MKTAMPSASSIGVNLWFLSASTRLGVAYQNPQHFKGLQSNSKQMSGHKSVRANSRTAPGVRPSRAQQASNGWMRWTAPMRPCLRKLLRPGTRERSHPSPGPRQSAPIRGYPRQEKRKNQSPAAPSPSQSSLCHLYLGPHSALRALHFALRPPLVEPSQPQGETR